jgi:hypothetical protein
MAQHGNRSIAQRAKIAGPSAYPIAARAFWPSNLQVRCDLLLELSDPALVTFVESPPLDSLRLHEIGLAQNPHVFA